MNVEFMKSVLVRGSIQMGLWLLGQRLLSACTACKMAFNLSHVLSGMEQDQDPPTPSPGSRGTTASPSSQHRPTTTLRRLSATRSPTSPTLIRPLPGSKVIHAESVATCELELDKQQRQAERERQLAEALRDAEWEVERLKAREANGTWSRAKGKSKDNYDGQKDSDRKTDPFLRPPQAYELYQAIDKKDIMFIMRVRDHAFPLLLHKSAGEFPIVYAARIGDSHKDIAILILGALSRYVNHLEDDDFGKKETKDILKALRANLKMAMDHALLPASSPHLLSSYLQVLLMSEGDAWIHKATHDVALLLRNENSAEAMPVKSAEALVRRFCTKELRGVEGGVEGVEEYIANATMDLVIMGAWDIVSSQTGAEPLPTYTFARDLRTHLMFVEACNTHRSVITSKCGKRLRGILAHLRDLGGDTRKSMRGRLRDVANVLDR